MVREHDAIGADEKSSFATIDKLVSMNILTEKVGGIVKAELNELKAELPVPHPEIIAVGHSDNHSES